MGVAHDVIEHRVRDSGSIEDELLALGACLLVRGQGGYWANSFSCPGYHIGSDIGEMLGLQYGGVDDGIADPGRTLPLSSDVEAWISKAITQTQRLIRDDSKSHLDDDVLDFCIRARGWLRRGYRRAQHRYQGISPFVLTHLFQTIEKQADRFLADDDSLYAPLVVRFLIRDARTVVYLEYSDMEDM